MARSELVSQGPPPVAPLPPPVSIRSFLESDMYRVGFFEETAKGLKWNGLDSALSEFSARRKLRRYKNVPGVQILGDAEIAKIELDAFYAANAAES